MWIISAVGKSTPNVNIVATIFLLLLFVLWIVVASHPTPSPKMVICHFLGVIVFLAVCVFAILNFLVVI